MIVKKIPAKVVILKKTDILAGTMGDDDKQKLLRAKAKAYLAGKDGRQIKKPGDKATHASNICKNAKKGDLLFSGIHNRTIFTGTPDRDEDNLTILRLMDSESVDLIYLDPPFNSKRDYAAPVGSAAEGVGAFFSDIWHSADRNKLMEEELLAISPSIYAVIHSAGLAMGKSARSYLTFMATRLLEMRRVLKETGSIYLHCDPTMSHSVKMMMDAIFGAQNFLNDIAWCYRKWTNATHHFQRNKDNLLFYSKSGDYYFNKQYDPNAPQAAKYARGWDSNRIKGARQLIVYDEEKAAEEIKKDKYDRIVLRTNTKGTALSDWWVMNYLASGSKERTGYPTQKPRALLERIISASTKESDIVLDPFCGCGTACDAAELLKRNWIGIDASAAAAVVMIELRQSGQGGLHEKRDLVNWRVIDGNQGLPVREDGGDLVIDPAADKKTTPKNKSRLTTEEKEKIVKHCFDVQRGECPGCGEQKPLNDFTVDHIIPISKGGTDDPENLQAMCFKCNALKKAGTMQNLWRILTERGDRISRQGAQWAIGELQKKDKGSLV